MQWWFYGNTKLGLRRSLDSSDPPRFVQDAHAGQLDPKTYKLFLTLDRLVLYERLPERETRFYIREDMLEELP